MNRALSSRLAIITGGIGTYTGNFRKHMACCRRIIAHENVLVGGIGSSVGTLLRSQGAKLALLYAPFEADKVKSTLDGVYGSMSAAEVNDVKAYACDVTNPKSVDDAFQEIIGDRTAFPSILVNAAGYVALR